METRLMIGAVLTVQAAVMTAFGATWSGTVSFGEDADVTEAVSLSGAVTVAVAGGKTATVTGVISGDGGSLVKEGAGRLVLSAANTFDGGVTLADGFLDVKPYKDGNGDWVVDNASLGSGTLTLTGDGKHDCQLGLWGRNVGSNNFNEATLRLANPIAITGNTTKDYPAFVVYYENVILTGKLTALRDCYFYDDYTTTAEICNAQSSRATYVRSLTFAEVEVAGTLAQDGNCRFDFPLPIKTKTLDFATDFRNCAKFGGQDSNRSSCYHFAAPNEIGTLLCGSMNGVRSFYFEAPNAFSNALVQADSKRGGQLYSAGVEVSVGGLLHNADVTKDQTKTMSNGAVNGNWPYVSGRTHGTLKITGVPLGAGETAKGCRTTRELINLSAVTLDAYPGFTQEFAVLSNRMDGVLDVRRGTLKVSQGASFTCVPTVTCGGEGCLDIAADAGLPAFTACRTLTAGGAMTLGAARDDFPSLTALNVASNGTLTLSRAQPLVTAVTVNAGGELVLTGAAAAGCLPAVTRLDVYGKLTVDPSAGDAFRTDRSLVVCLYDGGMVDLNGGTLKGVDSLYLNGVRQYNGEWTSAQEPVKGIIAPGSAIEVVNGPAAAGTSAVWTGKGADDAMTTAENWEEVPASLTDGSAVITIRGGTGMAFADGMRVAKILDEGDQAFAITGVTPTARLVVDGLVSVSNNNLTLGGAIDTPFGLYQAYPTTSGSGSLIDAQFSRAREDRTLKLDNATIGKSIRLNPPYQKCSLVTTDGSTNAVKGSFYVYDFLNDWVLGADSELSFSGGLKTSVCVRQHGGTVRVVGRPLVRTSSSVSAWQLCDSGRLVLDVSGNDIGVGTNKSYASRKSVQFSGPGSLATLKDHALTNGCVSAVFGYSDSTKTLKTGDTVAWELAATQTVDVVEMSNVGLSSALRGQGGAMVEVLLCGTNRVNATGDVGFHMKGEGTLLIGGRRDLFTPDGVPLAPGGAVPEDRRFLPHESTGPLLASSGVLELGADCSWRNGTDFTASGSGTLKFASASQVDRKAARLHLADGGRVCIPEGVTLSVSAADVDGQPVGVGVYPGDGPSPVDGHVVGGGRLKVGRRGFVFVVR